MCFCVYLTADFSFLVVLNVMGSFASLWATNTLRATLVASREAASGVLLSYGTLYCKLLLAAEAFVTLCVAKNRLLLRLRSEGCFLLSTGSERFQNACFLNDKSKHFR